MIRRSFRRGLALGLLVGAVVTAYKLALSRRDPVSEPAVDIDVAGAPAVSPVAVHVPEPVSAPEPVATPEPPKPKKAAARKKPAPKSIEPVDGGCPDSHPVKAKLGSGIFHVPGGFNYPRTKPDRCYVDAAAAEADGLRLSKR